jgi:hypothetical protein
LEPVQCRASQQMQATHVRDGAVSHVGSDQGQSQTEVRSTPRADVADTSLRFEHGACQPARRCPWDRFAPRQSFLIGGRRTADQRLTCFASPVRGMVAALQKGHRLGFTQLLASSAVARVSSVRHCLRRHCLQRRSRRHRNFLFGPSLRFLVPRPVLQLALSLFALTLPSAPSARLVTVWSHQLFDSVNA